MLKVICVNMRGNLGSFQDPRSNNSSKTFSIPTKSSIIGLIAAVIGIDKETMIRDSLYKTISRGIKYSVVLKKPFRKTYWNEYRFNSDNIKQSNRPLYTPGKYERLLDLDYDVYIQFDDSQDLVNRIIGKFVEYVKCGKTTYIPYFGMMGCFANLKYINEYIPEERDGNFKTLGFCTDLDLNDKNQDFKDLMSDDIPTYNLGYLTFDSKSYKTIYLSRNNKYIYAYGKHFKIGDEYLEFI